MIRVWLASAIYVLAAPIAVLYKLFADPLALKKSNKGWHRRKDEEPTIENAKRPFI